MTSTWSTSATPRGPRSAPAANLGSRIGALVIDGALSLIAVSPSLVAYTTIGDGSEGINGAFLALSGLGLVLALVLVCVQLWSEGTRGGTLGKRWVGLRVVDFDSGSTIGVARAFGRLFIRGLPFVVFSPLFDARHRRGWHDQAIGSVVLDGRYAAASPARRRAVSMTAPVAPPPPASRGTQPPPPPSAAASRAVPSPPDFYGAPTGAVPVVGDPSQAAPLPPSPPVPAPPVPAPPVPVPPAPPVPATAERVEHAAPLVPAEPAEPAVPALTSPVAPSPAVEVPLPPAQPEPQPVAPAPTISPEQVAPEAPAIPEAPVMPEVPAEPAPSAATVPVPAVDPRAPRHAAPRESGISPVLPPSPDRFATAAATDELAVAYGSAAAAEFDDLDDLDDHTHVVESRRVREDPRALLHLSDGRKIAVKGTVLIGRKPSRSGGVRADQLVAVADPARALSKNHLLVGVDEDGVWVVDQNSTNGTIITLPDGQQILCAGGQSVRLPVGAAVTAGDLVIRFEFDPKEGRP